MLFESLVTGAASGLLGGAFGYAANERNINMQRDTNRQNEGLMRESWAREDNSVQRRTADLKAAGLSPVLAAGQGASSSSPIKMDAPKGEDWAGPAAAQAIQSTLAASQVAKTDADIRRTGAETNNIEANTRSTEQNMEQQIMMNAFHSKAISAQTYRTWVESQKEKYNLERDQRYSLGDKSSREARQAQDLLEAARLAGQGLKGKTRREEYDPKKLVPNASRRYTTNRGGN